MANQIQLFNFRGEALEVVQQGADLFVSVRRVCEALGVSNQGQALKLASTEWAVVKEMLTTGLDGKSYTMTSIHLDSLPMWLATIKPGKVAEEVRPKLLAFQKEAARALADHFFGRRGVGSGDPLTRDLNRKVNAIKAMQRAGALTKDQAAAEMRKLAFEMGWVESPEMPTLPPAPLSSAAQWLRECCTFINDEAISRWTPAAVAYAHYCDWCRAGGVRPLYVRHLKAVVVESGATARKSSGVFYSISILPPSTDGRAA